MTDTINAAVQHTTSSGHTWTLEENFFAPLAPDGTPGKLYTRPTPANGMVDMSVATAAEAEAFDAFCARYFSRKSVSLTEERDQMGAIESAWRAAAEFFEAPAAKA